MANRFWVGGTNTWNATLTGKWSTTSGGAAGAAVPTAADDVFFDANSGAGTITLGVTGACRSLTTTGFTGTFTGTNALNIGTTTGGGLTIGSGATWNYSGPITFVSSSSHIVTTNGKTFGGFTVNGTNALTVTLGDNNTTTTGLAIVAGTLNTNGKTVIAPTLELVAVGSNTRVLSCGASNITCANFYADQSLGTTTITAGTSTITVNGDGGLFVTLNYVGATFNNLILGSATNTSGGLTLSDNGSTGTVTIAVNSLHLVGYISWSEETGGSDVFTVNGPMTLGGSPALSFSSSDGTQISFVANGTITPSTGTVADINASGTGSWNFLTSGAALTDGGNNTGITFPAAGSVGAATGVATVSGIGASVANSVGSSTGSATASGVGKAIITSVGTATGIATVSGVAFEKDLTVGTSIGIATVSGVGAAAFYATGTALGVATVLGISPIKMFTVGTAIGTCLVQAQGNIAPQSPTPQPTEDYLNIFSPTENALNILNPVEYGENIRQPTEYAA